MSSSQQPSQHQPAHAVRRLELAVDPETGSLRTVPLLHVLLSATDGLYTDLHQMTMGEIKVSVGASGQQQQQQQPSSSSSSEPGGDASTNPATNSTKSERMANLSFAQRRHELSWRLHGRAKALQHAAAVAAAQAASLSLASSSSSSAASSSASSSSSTPTTTFPTTFGGMVALSSKALQVARSAWRHADEAQDALYFFHAQLFPSRRSPHDIFGASDVLLQHAWHDLPNDVTLLSATSSDRYAASDISTWTKAHVEALWRLNVQNKLVRGEMGWRARQRQKWKRGPEKEEHDDDNSKRVGPPSPSPRLWWKSSLRGGVLTLTHGEPAVRRRDDDDDKDNAESSSTLMVHPITALVTVLSSPPRGGDDADRVDDNKSASAASEASSFWTLLSVNVHVQAKTGEFQHQLETNRRQKYDLHRLCAHAMAREEARARQPRQRQPSQPQHDVVPARPLHALFQVSHAFLLSWQLELLSAQALSLRRGAWNASSGGGGGAGGIGGGGGGGTTAYAGPGSSSSAAASPKSAAGGGGGGTAYDIQVTPVHFFDQPSEGNGHHGDQHRPLGALSVSFWRVDDTYGPPSMSDVVVVPHQEEDGATRPTVASSSSERHTDRTDQLTLTIRATLQHGIIASLSGFSTSVAYSNADPLIDTEDARQEIADVDRAARLGIQSATGNPLALSMSDALLSATRWCADRKCRAVARALRTALPHWIELSVDRGGIAVAAAVRYHDGRNQPLEGAPGRSTRRDAPTLFRLTCDARNGSFVACFSRECQLLRELVCNSLSASEPMALRIASLPTSRRRAAGASGSGRAARDAFQGLLRSMNLLGQRVGVGGAWDDLDDQSSTLRERSIRAACADVKVSLVKACGMAALYGLSAVSMGAALGLDAVPDMAGDTVPSLNGVQMLPAPPLSVLADQELVETSSTAPDGSTRKVCYLAQSLFSMVCSVSEVAGIVLYALDVRVKLESPSSPPQQEGSTPIPLIVEGAGLPGDGASVPYDAHSPPAKRAKLPVDENRSLVDESGRLRTRPLMEEASRLAEAISNAMFDASPASQ